MTLWRGMPAAAAAALRAVTAVMRSVPWGFNSSTHPPDSCQCGTLAPAVCYLGGTCSDQPTSCAAGFCWAKMTSVVDWKGTSVNKLQVLGLTAAHQTSVAPATAATVPSKAPLTCCDML
jgi:hypothetical protein